MLFPDDGFYYLKIAQNIAQGLGSTFDGINPNNRYYPFWMLILIPLAKCFSSPLDFAWSVLILQAIIAGLGFALLAQNFKKHFKSEYTFWVAEVLIFINPISLAMFVDGLEYALYFLFLSSAFCLLIKYWKNNQEKIWFLLGVFLGLTFLARLDAVFLIFWLELILFLEKDDFSSRLKKTFSFMDESLGYLYLVLIENCQRRKSRETGRMLNSK